MIKLTSILKDKYYRYVPGEFYPVYRDGKLDNTREFHKYKIRKLSWALKNWRLYYAHYTHSSSF